MRRICQHNILFHTCRNFRRRDKEEIERKFRRLNERFGRLDTEKNATQKAIEQLQNEIHSLNMLVTVYKLCFSFKGFGFWIWKINLPYF